MPPKLERYNPKKSYENDPRSHVVGIVQLVTARTAEEGLHGNIEPFVSSLFGAIRSRQYLDVRQVVITLKEIQRERDEASHTNGHDWREQAILEVIEKLTPSTKREQPQKRDKPS